MQTKDLMTIANVALGTAMLTVMTFWSGPLEAGNEGAELSAKIAKPKLVLHGIELTLAAAGGRSFQAGDEPAFDLQARNTTGEPGTVAVRVGMTSSAPRNELSRVIAQPTALWQQPQFLTLQPNETKTVTIATHTKLPANAMISVSLDNAEPIQASARPEPAARAGSKVRRSTESGVVVMSFSTASAPLLAASGRLP